MRKKRRVKEAFSGYFAFFSVIALTVTFAVIIYDGVREVYGADKKAISAIMLVVCLGLSLFCTTIDFVRRRLTVDRTVEQILEATEKIKNGHFEVRLIPAHSYKKYDDLDYIMENVNRMAEGLSENEMLKNDFISNVSHEIKTPLSIIQNYASALQNDKLDSSTREAYVKTLVRASARLSDLVMNILKLNKLENQNSAPEMRFVRLDEMLAQAVFGFEAIIESKNLQLECDIDEISVMTSPSHLEIVWNNLLSNAIKFTPDGGSIFISLKRERGNAVVKIRDSGIGMSKETGRRIFDKFYQGDTSHAKEGNGLGLALVKRVIDILGGEISVESELGKGTSFSVTLSERRNDAA